MMTVTEEEKALQSQKSLNLTDQVGEIFNGIAVANGDAVSYSGDGMELEV
jgi:hypothetical protein